MPSKRNLWSGLSREIVIGVVMSLVLGIALLLSYGLSVARRVPWLTDDDGGGFVLTTVRVGDLQLAFPKGWQPVPDTEPMTDLFDEAAVYIDPLLPQRRMMMACVRTTVARSPLVARSHVLQTLKTEQSSWRIDHLQSSQPFRVGTLTGLMVVGLSRDREAYNLHLMAILTEDARRYWVVSVSHLDAGSRLEEAKQMAGMLLVAVSRTMVSHRHRDAGASDIRAAGLGGAILKWSESLGLLGRVFVDGVPDESICFIPSDAHAQVHLLRVRGTVDTGGGVGDPLSPGVLLKEQLVQARDESIEPGGVWSGRVNGAPAWRLTLADASGTLVRQVWYIRVGDGRGILVEVLGEPGAVNDTAAWISTLIGAVTSESGPSPPFSPKTGGYEVRTDAAIRSGKKIVAYQVQQLSARSEPVYTYRLIQSDGQMKGYQYDLELPREPDDPLPLHGRTLTHVRGTPLVWIHREWRVSLDGSRFWINTHQTHDAPGGDDTPAVSSERMRLTDGRLGYERSKGQQSTEQWNIKVPSAYVLPMAEDIWPLEPEGHWDEGPALVWMAYGRRPPRPYWVRLTAVRDSPHWPADPSLACRYVLAMRPMMSLDTDRLGLDKDGRVVYYQTRQLSGWTRGATVLVRRVGRRALIEVFPSLEETLSQETLPDHRIGPMGEDQP